MLWSGGYNMIEGRACTGRRFFTFTLDYFFTLLGSAGSLFLICGGTWNMYNITNSRKGMNDGSLLHGFFFTISSSLCTLRLISLCIFLLS